MYRYFVLLEDTQILQLQHCTGHDMVINLALISIRICSFIFTLVYHLFRTDAVIEIDDSDNNRGNSSNLEVVGEQEPTSGSVDETAAASENHTQEDQ